MDLDSMIFLGAASIFGGSTNKSYYESVIQAKKLWKELLDQKKNRIPVSDEIDNDKFDLSK